MAWTYCDINDNDLMNRRGIISISYEMVERILCIPSDVRVVNFTPEPIYGALHIHVRGMRFPIVAEGAAAPTYRLDELEDHDE